MARKILGVDIGCNQLKLALVSGGIVRKSACVPMPNRLLRDGRIVSDEVMGELIHDTMRQHGIRCNRAALVLSSESVFIRTIMMPRMTVDQLVYNIPYEFHDYITDELTNYIFDYAMTTSPEMPDSEWMELMAVAAPAALIEEFRVIFRKAGLKLTKAAPCVSSYISLIRALKQDVKESCILDLGFQSIRMYMFQGDRHIVTRIIEIGLNHLDDVIAETYHIDIHLAHTYLLTNYEHCQYQNECTSAYHTIAVELMRALNFYRFSNPESKLNDIWLCGGGAIIQPLRDVMTQTLDMHIHHAEELIPNGQNIDTCYALVQAIGITMED